jgi:predicted nucleotidyltransferase
MTEIILNYLTRLTKKYRDVESVWLLGSRANGNARPNSDWDFLVFTNQSVFDRMKQDLSFKDPNIDLLVVYNGTDFEEPWPALTNERPAPKGGHLGKFNGWDWCQQTETTATYHATKELPDGSIDSQTKKAIRVWP